VFRQERSGVYAAFQNVLEHVGVIIDDHDGPLG